MEKKGSPLRVSLSYPSAGWIEVTVEIPDHRYCQPVSFTLNDFVHELVAALHLSMHGQETVAAAFCEPTTFEFTFSPIQNTDRLLFQIVQYPDWSGSKAKGQIVLSFQGTRRLIVLRFWRALKSLEGRVQAEKYCEAMGRDFPTQNLRTLSNLLGKDR
jgi:hypothetical protein